MSGRRLYLIDATAFCYRAFYALKGLASSSGQPTNAIYGFVNMLNKVLKENRPEYLAVCFDVSRDTFRQKKFAEYKIQRPPMPEDLSSQIPLIKEIIAAYDIAIFEKEGFEADDIIATITKKAKKAGVLVTIISSDKDILQLVDSDTVVFSPYKDGGSLYDTDKVIERFGVPPNRITDIIALMGDDADNIPGLPGIGEKTALELISNFGSLEELFKNTNSIKQEKTKKIVTDNIALAKLSKELALLDDNVDIAFNLEELKTREPNYAELFKIFKFLEFKRFLKDLPQPEKRGEHISLVEINDTELKEELKGASELIMYTQSKDALLIYSKDRFIKVGSLGENARLSLNNKNLKKISYDLKKTKILLAKNNIVFSGLSFDIMIAAYLLNPSRTSYDLATIAWEYLGSTLDESDELECLSSVVKLRPKLTKELQEKCLFELFTNLEMPLVEVLSVMELNGIKIDLKVIKEISSDIEKRLIKLIQEIYAISESEFNINSPKQLREILFVKLKLPVVKKSKTGPSTDEEVLRKLSTKHKLPGLLLEYRQLTKLKNTYVDVFPDLVDKATGRIHATFNQTGTETGRLSSSSPNLQNIPVKTDIGRNIRRAIVASDKNNLLLSCDYSQVELRVLAHLSKDESLIKAFKENKDIHKATASLIYGISQQDITEDMREVAKRVNFGIVYGLSSFGLSRDLGISIEEAQGFIDSYFTRYPRVKEYIQSQINKVKEHGFVTTILGRRRYIPEISNKNQGIRQFSERQAVNTPIQGSASDLIKLAMVQIQERLKAEEMLSKMIIQIHDELVFDVAANELNKLKELVRNRMENVLGLEVPLRVEMKVGKNLLNMEEVK